MWVYLFGREHFHNWAKAKLYFGGHEKFSNSKKYHPTELYHNWNYISLSLMIHYITLWSITHQSPCLDIRGWFGTNMPR